LIAASDCQKTDVHLEVLVLFPIKSGEARELKKNRTIVSSNNMSNNFVFSYFVAFFAVELTLKKRRNV
jgi:hypothetical protein